jgi:hypothetical protein
MGWVKSPVARFPALSLDVEGSVYLDYALSTPNVASKYGLIGHDHKEFTSMFNNTSIYVWFNLFLEQACVAMLKP